MYGGRSWDWDELELESIGELELELGPKQSGTIIRNGDDEVVLSDV